MKPDPKPTLSASTILTNIEHSRYLRMQAHSEYLKFKRQERHWRNELNKITTSDSVVNTAEVSQLLFLTERASEQ